MKALLFVCLFFMLPASAFSQATIEDIYNFLLNYGTAEGEYTPGANNGILVRFDNTITLGETARIGINPYENTVQLANDAKIKIEQDGDANKIQIAQDGTKNNVKTITGSVTTVDNEMANAVWVRWEDCAMSVRICQEGSEQPLRTTYDISGETPFYPDEQTKDRSEEILGPYDSIISGNNATEETLATMHDVTEHVSGGLAIIGSLSGTPINPPGVSTSVNSPTVQLNLRRGTQVSVGYSWSRITGIAGVIRQLLVGLVGWFTYWSAKTMIVGALVGTKMSEEARKVRATSSNPFAWQPPF